MLVNVSHLTELVCSDCNENHLEPFLQCSGLSRGTPVRVLPSPVEFQRLVPPFSQSIFSHLSEPDTTRVARATSVGSDLFTKRSYATNMLRWLVCLAFRRLTCWLMLVTLQNCYFKKMLLHQQDKPLQGSGLLRGHPCGVATKLH